MTSVRTTLLIPCYNEAEGIPNLCARLRVLLDRITPDGSVEVIFVDDGSDDGTADRIRQSAAGLPFRIVAHEENRGLGAALKTGFLESRGLEVVTLDSDCTYDPTQAVYLLHALRRGYDVVTGSPYHPLGEVVHLVRWRLYLSKFLSYLYWAVLPVHLFTYTSCFRAYRRDVLTKLDAESDGFLAVTQLLVSAILKGYRVSEVPARLTSRQFGRSKIRIAAEAFAHIRYLIRIPSLRAGRVHRARMAGLRTRPDYSSPRERKAS
jgi:dolichol-phosphate mannosyltransferase